MNKRRGQYASLDVGSMGVDVSMGPITNLDNKILDEVCPDDEDAETLLGKQENKFYSSSSNRDILKKPIDIMQESVESDKLVESVSEKDTKKDRNEEDIMSCMKKEEAEISTVVRRRPKKNNKSNENILPPGWEKHSDENGYYYWHVKSGTIQREYPQMSMGSAILGEEEKRELVRDVRSSIIYDDEFDANHLETALTSPQPTNKNSIQDSKTASQVYAKDSQVHQQNTSMHTSNVSSASSSSMSKSCTSSSIMDLGKEKETQKRRSLPPCKENEENNGSNNGSNSGVRPMQVRLNIHLYLELFKISVHHVKVNFIKLRDSCSRLLPHFTTSNN